MPSPTGRPLGHYAIVFGIYAHALQGYQKPEALTGFYYNAAAGMVTNSVKLIPLRPAGGTGIIILAATADRTTGAKYIAAGKDMLGLCCAASI